MSLSVSLIRYLSKLENAVTSIDTRINNLEDKSLTQEFKRSAFISQIVSDVPADLKDDVEPAPAPVPEPEPEPEPEPAPAPEPEPEPEPQPEPEPAPEHDLD